MRCPELARPDEFSGGFEREIIFLDDCDVVAEEFQSELTPHRTHGLSVYIANEATIREHCRSQQWQTRALEREGLIKMSLS